uniref:MFS domain-containing protein n=1 Tax=Heterorhabditis bacteriophora TaxID=37862 RepID=A0A1I7WPK2_HETBA
MLCQYAIIVYLRELFPLISRLLSFQSVLNCSKVLAFQRSLNKYNIRAKWHLGIRSQSRPAGSACSSRHASMSMPAKPVGMRGGRAQSMPMTMDVRLKAFLFGGNTYIFVSKIYTYYRLINLLHPHHLVQNFRKRCSFSKCVLHSLWTLHSGLDPLKAVYCKMCFIHMVKSKFRSTISKRRIFKDGEPRETMVVFDGSSSSAFLLHQIEDAVKQISFKRLMINPTVQKFSFKALNYSIIPCIVKTFQILVLVSVTDQSSITMIEQRVVSLKPIIPNAHWYILHLSSGLKKQLSLKDNGRCCDVDMIAELGELLSSCQSATAKAEAIRILKERTLQKAAISLGLTKVMLPCDGDFLGRSALTQICLGRGGTVSELTSVVDKRSCGVTFVRPLRDISLKEISIVNHLEGYEKTAIRMDINVSRLVPIPPDGGWGWIVVLGSFFIHVFADGFVYSFGVLVEVLMEEFGSDNATCAMIISLLTGLTLGSGPLASAICNKYGCRFTTILGSIIAAIGYHVLRKVSLMCLFEFMPRVLLILMVFLLRRRSLATGIAVAGAGVGTVLFSPINEFIISHYGWRAVFLAFLGSQPRSRCGTISEKEVGYLNRKDVFYTGSITNGVGTVFGPPVDLTYPKMTAIRFQKDDLEGLMLLKLGLYRIYLHLQERLLHTYDDERNNSDNEANEQNRSNRRNFLWPKDLIGMNFNAKMGSVASERVSIRLAFLRKVFGILSFQVVLTTVICTALYMTPGIREFVREQ